MENTLQIWETIKYELLNRSIVPQDTFQELFQPIKEIYRETPTNIFLLVENHLVKYRIDKFFLDTLNKLYNEITGVNKLFKFITYEQAEEETKNKNSYSLNKVSYNEINKTQRRLRSEYTFENFVTGEANRYAFVTAMKVAESPHVTINPLYIFGDVGLGKTHLMTAIGHYILDKDPSINVVYTTAQQFVEDYFNATTKKTVNAFQEFGEYYKSADVLLVDDIQLLANKNASQEEFFKLFEFLFENNKQIIITSDRRADELENIMMRLKSRFSWGIPVDIKKPNLELRKAIIKNKLSYLISNPSEVNGEVIDYIAENFCNNVRELEGALRRFVNYCVSFNIDFSLENAKISLESIITPASDAPDKIEFKNIDVVKKVISKHYSISVSDLSSSTRKKEVVLPRQIAIYLIRTLFNVQLQKIGDFFGSRDHATIAHAIAKVEKMVEDDWTVKQDIEYLIKNIKKEL